MFMALSCKMLFFENVVKSRPELVGFWAACYGSPEAPWMILDDGSRIEVISLFQGCGVSPDFFALGIRGLIRTVRKEFVSLPSAEDVTSIISTCLDDVIGIVPLEAMFDCLEKLRDRGPEIGHHLENIHKNFFFVPLRFKGTFLIFLAKREADRVIKVVTDETAGAI